MDLKQHIRTIPDFPEKGIMFRDVTTLFNNAEAFAEMIDQFHSFRSGQQIDAIAGIDARGFIIGGALAYKMGLPFVTLRKKGKLPFETISEEYNLEYGKATLEVHKDAIKPRANVLVMDDLIATGGTAVAGINLIRTLGGNVVGCDFIINLSEIGGAAKLEAMGVEVRSLVAFRGH